MYASPRYSRPHGNNHNNSSSSSSSYQPTPYKTASPSKYSHPQCSSPTKYNVYPVYTSPVKPTSYQQQSYGEYYSSPSSPTYYNQQHELYHSGASTASSSSSSSQEGPFYVEELDELDDYTMGLASPDMTTVPTVPTPVMLSLYEHGKTPSGRVMVTPGNQTIEFFSSVVNAPLSRCVVVHE